MTLPLMPRATAVWLVENTTLSFEQIAEFCGMHVLEVQGIADGDVAHGIIGQNPIEKGMLLKANIESAEKDPKVKLRLISDVGEYIDRQKKAKNRYTPVARRQDKPDAVSWLLKNYPDITDAQISKLIGTTKNTISAIRSKAHWNMHNIRPRDPVLLGLCTQTDLYALAHKIDEAKAKKAAEEEKAARKNQKNSKKNKPVVEEEAIAKQA